MFLSVLKLFKIGIGPSRSRTMEPMAAAKDFVERLQSYKATSSSTPVGQNNCTGGFACHAWQRCSFHAPGRQVMTCRMTSSKPL